MAKRKWSNKITYWIIGLFAILSIGIYIYQNQYLIQLSDPYKCSYDSSQDPGLAIKIAKSTEYSIEQINTLCANQPLTQLCGDFSITLHYPGGGSTLEYPCKLKVCDYSCEKPAPSCGISKGDECEPPSSVTDHTKLSEQLRRKISCSDYGFTGEGYLWCDKKCNLDKSHCKMGCCVCNGWDGWKDWSAYQWNIFKTWYQSPENLNPNPTTICKDFNKDSCANNAFLCKWDPTINCNEVYKGGGATPSTPCAVFNICPGPAPSGPLPHPSVPTPSTPSAPSMPSPQPGPSPELPPFPSSSLSPPEGCGNSPPESGYQPSPQRPDTPLSGGPQVNVNDPCIQQLLQNAQQVIRQTH